MELVNKMKHVTAGLLLLLTAGSFFLAPAQDIYTTNQLDYTIELPSTVWRPVSGSDAAHEHAEFVNGERLEGYLQIRKEVVDAGTTAADLSRRDMEQKLRFLPGFVEGKEEKFSGRLNGVTVSYEFVRTAKPMMGRIYYLQADNRTV